MNKSLSRCPPYADMLLPEDAPRQFAILEPQIIYADNFNIDLVMAMAVLTPWHWYLTESGWPRLNDSTMPKRIAELVASFLDDWAEDRYFPVRNADSERSIMTRETSQRIGRLLLARGLPKWPVDNVAVGLTVSGKSAATLSDFLNAPASIRYLRVQSFPAPQFAESVFRQQWDLEAGYSLLTQKLHWIVCDSTVKDTVESCYHQCIEAGLPLFVTRPEHVRPTLAVQAYPVEFNKMVNHVYG